MILSIDPGNEYSAYSILDEDLKPVRFGKVENDRLLADMEVDPQIFGADKVAIEMVACYGMPVGKEVFDTCVWIGRFYQSLASAVGSENICYIYRKDEKINLCGSMKAKDGNIRQALIDRFGSVGVKAKKGWFYGVSKDVWSAVACGVTYYDMHIKKDAPE